MPATPLPSGHPPGGFPEPLRTDVLKGKPVVDGRPGASLVPTDLGALAASLKSKHYPFTVSDTDVLSAALYPKVFDDYVGIRKKFSDLSVLPTRTFLEGCEIDREVCIELGKGQQTLVTLKAVGELLPNGKREVFFDVDGLPRVTEVVDRVEIKSVKSAQQQAVRDKANPERPGEIGAPMSGSVLEVKVEPGVAIKAGQALVVLRRATTTHGLWCLLPARPLGALGLSESFCATVLT